MCLRNAKSVRTCDGDADEIATQIDSTCMHIKNREGIEKKKSLVVSGAHSQYSCAYSNINHSVSFRLYAYSNQYFNQMCMSMWSVLVFVSFDSFDVYRNTTIIFHQPNKLKTYPY